MRRACGAALLLCALALALAHAHSYKRAEMSASPFVLSSRYGRSSARMAPRNDRSVVSRFFLTGRYGKRGGAGPPLRLLADRDRLRAGRAGDRDRLHAGRAGDRDRLSAGRASDRDRLSAGRASDRDRQRDGRVGDRDSWRLYARAGARASYYKRAPEVADSAAEWR